MAGGYDTGQCAYDSNWSWKTILFLSGWQYSNSHYAVTNGRDCHSSLAKTKSISMSSAFTVNYQFTEIKRKTHTKWQAKDAHRTI